MLGKAHLTIGMASAMTIMMPDNVPAALPVITGAAAGCLICDLDCESPREKSDSSFWRKAALLIVAAALLEDYIVGAGMWKGLAESASYTWCTGAAGFVLTCAFASISSHRGFSHSLLALLLETACLYLIFPQTAMPFAIAFLSHLILDLTNKKPVRILYPLKKGFSLGWFYADRFANKLCAAAGFIWLTVISIISLT